MPFSKPHRRYLLALIAYFITLIIMSLGGPHIIKVRQKPPDLKMAKAIAQIIKGEGLLSEQGAGRLV